jgi:hypothetical protein
MKEGNYQALKPEKQLQDVPKKSSRHEKLARRGLTTSDTSAPFEAL